MTQDGQEQTVEAKVLEQKVGHRLIIGEAFETATGRWKVIDIDRGGRDSYTVRKLD